MFENIYTDIDKGFEKQLKFNLDIEKQKIKKLDFNPNIVLLLIHIEDHFVNEY